MKILFLTTEGFDTPNPNNQMAMVMIRDFLNNGNKVHLIQSRRTKQFPDIPEMLKNRKNFTVDTIDRKMVGKKNFISRYLNEVKWAFQSFSKWRNIKDVDVVFLQSCPTATYQLLLLKMFLRKPILFNIYDMWPGNLIECGITKSRFLVWIFRVIQKIGYRCCSKISVLSNDMKAKLLNENVKKEKIVVVPAWFDDHTVMPVKEMDNKFLKKYKVDKSKFIVQFAGSIGYVFDYKIVLKVAKLLKKEKNIRFQIIGDGAFKDDFVKEAQENNLDNIDFYPLQPIDIVPDVYSSCDIEIIPLRETTIGVGVPSKAPLVMACEKVIVNAVEEESEYYQMFKKYGIGVAVPVGNAELFAEEILNLFNDSSKRENMAKAARKYSFENYSSTVCTRIFMDTFTEMTM